MKTVASILCVLSGEAYDEHAVSRAANMARNHQAKLCLAYIINKPEFVLPIFDSKKSFSSSYGKLKDSLQSNMQRIASLQCKGLDVETRLLEGFAFIEITREVLRNQRDFVIKTCENSAELSRLFTSDDMHLLRKCPCPVLMLKAEQDAPIKNILATVDLMESAYADDEHHHVQSQLNEMVFDYAVTLATAESANLHAASIWDAIGESFLRNSPFSDMTDDQVDSYIQQCEAECEKKWNSFLKAKQSTISSETLAYLQMQAHLIKGQPELEIPKLVQNCAIDMIVMGTVARTGLSGFIIGNTAESILEQVDCSVLAVKPEGFVSPVRLDS